jgi:hypothetical protein
MSKKLLCALMFVLCLGVVSAYSCYQESANVSNQTGIDGSCGLNYSGYYDYSTPIPPLVGFDIYYVKPKYSVGANWVAKVQNNTFLNISINSSCWNLNATTLILNVQPHHNFFGANFVRMRCGGSSGTIVYNYNQGAPVGQDASLGSWSGSMIDGDWNTYGWANDMGVGGRTWGDMIDWIPANWETNFSFVYEEAMVWDICVPQWEQDIPVCSNGNYAISYTDVNHCGSTVDLPANNGTIVGCHGSFCYQESASVVNQSGTDGSCNLSYGGSAGAYGTQSVASNFTKPPYATNNSLFAYKVGTKGRRFGSISQVCWSNSPNGLFVGLNSYAQYFYSYGVYSSYLICGDGIAIVETNTSVGGRNNIFNSSHYLYALDGNWSTFASNWWVISSGNWLDNNASVQANPSSYYPAPEQYASFIYEDAVLWNICQPNWVSNNSVCNGVNYTILYSDANNCGSSIDLPANNGTVVSCLSCNPTWTAYYNPENCTLGYRTKLYYDSSYCNRTINLPFDNGTISSCNIFSSIGTNQSVKLWDYFKVLAGAPVGAVVNMSVVYPNLSSSQYSASWNGAYFESPSVYAYPNGTYGLHAFAGNQSITTNISVTDYEAVIPTQFNSVASAGENLSFLLQIYTDSNYSLNHSISCSVPVGFTCVIVNSILVTGSANTSLIVMTNVSLGDGLYYGELNVTRMIDGRVFTASLPLGISSAYGQAVITNPASFTKLMYSNEIVVKNYTITNVGNYNLSGCNVTVDGSFAGMSFVYGSIPFSIAPNESGVVSVSYVQPPFGLYTGYFNVFCVASAGGFVNGLSNPQLQQLFVLPYTAPFTPAGGGGGAPPFVLVSNVSATAKIFSLLNKDGSANGYVSYSYGGDSFSKTFVVDSHTADTLKLTVSCRGDFCSNVKLSKTDITLAGFGTDFFTSTVAVPDGVSLNGVYTYEIVLADSSGKSVSLLNEVHISSLSAWYSKFSPVVEKGDAGFWFGVGGFNVPKLLLYFVLVVVADLITVAVMPKNKFYKKNIMLILTFVSLVVFGLSALIF